MIDANGNSTDMPEAFVDYNENGVFDAATEPYFDFNGSGAYNLKDGQYNGVLCTAGAAICSSQKSIDVRGSQIIVFSSSDATISINDNIPIALTPCNPAFGNTPSTITVAVVDVNGNAMPAGTQVRFTSDNGIITAATANPYIVPDTIGCRTNNPVTGAAYDCPASAGSATFMNIPVTVVSDAAWIPADPLSGTPARCTNPSSIGTLSITVTTPKGIVTGAGIRMTD